MHPRNPITGIGTDSAGQGGDQVSQIEDLINALGKEEEKSNAKHANTPRSPDLQQQPNGAVQTHWEDAAK